MDNMKMKFMTSSIMRRYLLLTETPIALSRDMKVKIYEDFYLVQYTAA